MNFAKEKSVIPDHPFMFVVPPTLVDQVAFECNRFLESGSFDIITYTAGYKVHKDVWEVLDTAGISQYNPIQSAISQNLIGQNLATELDSIVKCPQ